MGDTPICERYPFQKIPACKGEESFAKQKFIGDDNMVEDFLLCRSAGSNRYDCTQGLEAIIVDKLKTDAQKLFRYAKCYGLDRDSRACAKESQDTNTNSTPLTGKPFICTVRYDMVGRTEEENISPYSIDLNGDGIVEHFDPVTFTFTWDGNSVAMCKNLMKSIAPSQIHEKVDTEKGSLSIDAYFLSGISFAGINKSKGLSWLKLREGTCKYISVADGLIGENNLDGKFGADEIINSQLKDALSFMFMDKKFYLGKEIYIEYPKGIPENLGEFKDDIKENAIKVRVIDIRNLVYIKENGKMNLVPERIELAVIPSGTNDASKSYTIKLTPSVKDGYKIISDGIYLEKD